MPELAYGRLQLSIHFHSGHRMRRLAKAHGSYAHSEEGSFICRIRDVLILQSCLGSSKLCLQFILREITRYRNSLARMKGMI